MRTKQEHFVPQSYLRRFTSDGKSIHVLNKPDLRIFTTNVRNIAGEKGFYDLASEEAKDMGSDPQETDNALTRLEPKFKDAIDAVLERADAGESAVLDDRLRRDLAHFLVIQNMRTRERRATTQQTFEKLGETLAKRFPDLKDSSIAAGADEQRLSLFQTAQLFDPEVLRVLTSALLDHIWYLGRSPAEAVLYTSDHPFVRRAHYQDAHRSNLGLASPGIELACPLNSLYVLVLMDRVAFRTYENMDDKMQDLQAENVIYFNSLQVFQSYRQVYCAAANAFDLAIRICRERPDVRDLGRKRVVVE